MSNDTIIYQYGELEQGLDAIKKAADTLVQETSGLKSDTQRLFGSDFVGTSADEYNRLSGEIQQTLGQKSEYITSLHQAVEAAIQKMRDTDSQGAKQIGG